MRRRAQINPYRVFIGSTAWELSDVALRIDLFLAEPIHYSDREVSLPKLIRVELQPGVYTKVPEDQANAQEAEAKKRPPAAHN